MAGQVKDPARNAEIVRLRKDGLEPCDIATRLRLNRNVILGVLYRNGLTAKNCELSSRASYTPAFRDRVLSTFEGLGIEATAKRWGISTSTILAWSRGL